jgi:hypothetical protein
MKLHHKIIINVSRERLFNLLLDVEKTPEYDDEVESVKSLMADKDELRFIYTMKRPIAKNEGDQVIMRISGINYPESYTMVLELEGVKNTTTTKLIALDERSTNMITHSEMSTKSRFLNFFINITSFIPKRKVKRKFKAFKIYAEKMLSA